MKTHKYIIMILSTLLLCGCSGSQGKEAENQIKDYPDSPAVKKSEVLYNQFDGPAIDCEAVLLDISHQEDGYIGACLKEESSQKIKLRLEQEDKIYTYDVLDTEMKAFPLNMGDGVYSIKVYQQVEGDSYALLYAQDLDVKLENELLPYLYPNQMVDYQNGSMIVEKSFEITKDDTNDLERVYDLFVYTLESLSYDDERAELARNTYLLPDIEGSLSAGKGICYDYSSILSALCRVQQIPARIVVGYTDIDYHSWVEIYLENYGWVNPKLTFNSEEWSLVDPTFADSGQDYEGNYDEVYHY